MHTSQSIVSKTYSKDQVYPYKLKEEIVYLGKSLDLKKRQTMFVWYLSMTRSYIVSKRVKIFEFKIERENLNSISDALPLGRAISQALFTLYRKLYLGNTFI